MMNDDTVQTSIQEDFEQVLELIKPASTGGKRYKRSRKT
jgi:hypothetical protein